MATTAGEIGRIGQKRYGGFFYEEFLKELQGRKGVETYREMADNDDVIGAILFAIEMLIRQEDRRTQTKRQQSLLRAAWTTCRTPGQIPFRKSCPF